ncbi:MAG TPA: PilN domain-containing protein [Steroidobacteraceae bacterium]|nr:PilN domain-containing protein [Steroidobacteraceae bacterium]
MPRINLLPWREAQRRERKLHFAVALGAAALASVAVSFIAYLMLDSEISAQVHRNTILRNEIKVLDKEIEEINGLEADKQRFIERMEIIEKLQRSRPEIVHLFDEIVRTLPDGVYLTHVKQTDRHLRFEGIAQSSTRVSAFMRNIDASQWLKNPALEVIETKRGETEGSSFVLDAEQVNHVESDTDDTPPPGRGPLRRVARAGDAP